MVTMVTIEIPKTNQSFPSMPQKLSKIEDVPHKANLGLQMLLQLNVYLSSIWALIYGFYISYNISTLNDLHGILVLLGYITAGVAEWWRLYAGYSGNLRARLGDLNTFLIISPLIQLPIFIFLLLSAKSLRLVITVISFAIFACMLLEFLIGIYTWRQLCYQQNEIFKLRRQIYLQKKATKEINETLK